MTRSKPYKYEVLPSSGSSALRPGYTLVPYRPNEVLRSLRSCPAALDTFPHLQLLFNERFETSKLSSPRGTLLIDQVCDPPEDLVGHLRASGNTWTQGRITLSLAETGGSCQGVNQAIQSAYAAIDESGGKLHLAVEIFQTGICQELDKGYALITSGCEGRDFSQVQAGDIVLLPTFGTTFDEVESIRRKGAAVITTVCPRLTEGSTMMGFCTVIHGTKKKAEVPDSGNYIFVENLEVAQYLGNYILSGDREDDVGFRKKFQGLTSQDFDPQAMLNTIVFKSQTRCSDARKERGEIEDLLRSAMIEKFGIDRMDDHFITSDCGYKNMVEQRSLLEAEEGVHRKLDVIIVVGPFDSRRAKHLQHCAKIAKIATYWIDSSSCINTERNSITWQDSRRRIGSTFGFLPIGETLVGVMPEASVSDQELDKVLQEVYDIQRRDI